MQIAKGTIRKARSSPGSYNKFMSMKRRTVLVTGASRGLGRGIALELAAAGYNVAINYRGNREAAEQTAVDCQAIAPEGSQFLPIQGDIADTSSRTRLVDETLAVFGEIYALVNNAGIAPSVRADITEASEESFEALMRTNLQGPYFLTQEVVRRWLSSGRVDDATDSGPAANRGRGLSTADSATTAVNDKSSGPSAVAPSASAPRHHIVFVTSISAATVSVSRGEYCVSKAGLAMATQLWAARLAHEGINVYEVRPGIMATDMTAGVKAKYDTLIAEGLVPQRRWGTPEDVGRSVRVLVQGDLPFGTGSVIDADGGFHISRL